MPHERDFGVIVEVPVVMTVHTDEIAAMFDGYPSNITDLGKVRRVTYEFDSRLNADNFADDIRSMGQMRVVSIIDRTE